DVITIAGMGGSLIAHILKAGKDKLSGKERLVLQPNIHAHHIREWLYQEGYALINEEILEEDGKYYEVLVAEAGDRDAAYDGISFAAGMLVGPFLAKQKNAVFIKKWSQELKHTENIYQQIEAALPSAENQQKLLELSKRIEVLKEVLRR
ncbi:SAM-dependent methyltransferase, partial [Bacillus amyloliquefaciens]